MNKKIVLIGAGSAQFGYSTLSDIFQSKILEGSMVVIHDINKTALESVLETSRSYIADNDLPFDITASGSRREALEGADFCIISIEIGDRFELWDQDWKVPLQYGIRQVYGENGGPGGLFHSLRIIPPILEICADIKVICPEAFVLNLSNPMSRICLTVRRKYPDLRFFGLCHEILSVPKDLPRILNTPLDNLHFRAGGLNHFSVLVEVRYRDTGRDAYPELLEKAPAYFEREYNNKERGLFKVLMDRFHCLPITTDSHLGEYVQWAHDVVDHRGILDFYSWYQSDCRVQVPQLQAEASGERLLPILEGIVHGSDYEEWAVNMPNVGLIDGLPRNLVVEVPALVGKNGIRGIKLGKLPPGFTGLLLNQAAVHDLTAEAVLNGSRELALQALLVDPVVHSFKAAEQTLDTMIELQKTHLGYLQ